MPELDYVTLDKNVPSYVTMDNVQVSEPNVYDGLTPDETYKRAGEVWDTAADIGLSIQDIESFYEPIVQGPQMIAPRRDVEEKLSTIAP